MDQNNQNNKQGNEQATKKGGIISAVVIVVVLAGLFLLPGVFKKNATTPTEEETTLPDGCKPGNQFSETTGEPCPLAEEKASDGSLTIPPASSAVASADVLSRIAALEKYKDISIRFSGESCDATPEKFEVAKGTTILIDNETAKSHTIELGPKKYAVSSLHYTLPWITMDSGTYPITCDGEEVGEIVVK
ncbi:hypothetical protein IT401_01845 [Candidatus Nomurabacteria bacterium]|nr:hypothetical protein [Candidatus Nomurabacteria bacterium]